MKVMILANRNRKLLLGQLPPAQHWPINCHQPLSRKQFTSVEILNKVGVLPTDPSSCFFLWIKEKIGLRTTSLCGQKVLSSGLGEVGRVASPSNNMARDGLTLSLDGRDFKTVSCLISFPADSIVPDSWEVLKFPLELNNSPEKSFPGHCNLRGQNSFVVSFGYSKS